MMDEGVTIAPAAVALRLRLRLADDYYDDHVL